MAKIVVVGGGQDPHGCPSGRSYALVTGKATYMLDCGDACGERLSLYGIDLLSVRSVFISHMHYDHLAGLFGFLFNVWALCRREEDVPPAIREWANWRRLPDSALPASLTIAVPQEGVRTLEEFLPAVYLARELWRFDLRIQPIQPGLFYEDDGLRAWAYPNGHLSSQPANLPLLKRYPWLNLESYSFAIETEGVRLVYSGDLALSGEAGVEEFRPLAQTADVLIVEVAHLPLEHHLDMLASTPAKRIILVHVHANLRSRLAAYLEDHPDSRFIWPQNGMHIEI